MGNRKFYWSVPGVASYSRMGYVDELKVFGYNIYTRCGCVYKIFGITWVNEQ